MVNIRRYREEDIPFIMKGEKYFEHLYYEGVSFSEDFFKENLFNENILIYIFEYNLEVAGYIIICLIDKESYHKTNKDKIGDVNALFIDDKFRGKNISKKAFPYCLFDFFYINKEEIDGIRALVLEDNYSSLKSCKSVGFEKIGDFIEVKDDLVLKSEELYLHKNNFILTILE